MRAVLIAALIAASAAPAFATTDTGVLNNSRPFGSGLRSVAEDCKALGQKAVDKGSGRFAPLNRMPPAMLEHAVLRIVEGCPVREVVYQGQTYFVQPSIPTVEPAAPVQKVSPTLRR